MSEPFMRPRPDLGGYDAQGQRLMTDRDDPLAELARLVGKEDPFRGDRAMPASNVAHFPQVGAQQHEAESQDHEPEDFHPFDQSGHPDFDAQLRGSLDARHQAEAPPSLHFPRADNTPEAFEPALGYPVAGGQSEAPPLNADLWAEGALPQDGPSGDLFQQPTGEAHDGRAPRRTLVVLAAVLALTGGGLAATFLMRDGSGMHVGGGAPPTILAADTPAKVQSPDMTSGSNPDGNTALLERSGSDKVDNAKVVTTNEQPVDLNQLPKAASAVNNTAAPSGAAPNAFPEPRKVKTFLIRPDGSVVGEVQQQAAVATPIGMVMPTAAGGPPPAVAPAQAPAEPVAKPSTPKSTVRASATPVAPAANASGAKQPAAPVRSTKPVAVASAAPAATPNEDVPAATPGTWSVQLGAPPSEQEAKDMSSRLQKKFASELGGLRPAIVKADRDGKPIYRVRIGNLAQNDAKSLCTKLQGSGGSCFVVRN